MMIQAYDILELFIELLHTRMALLKMQKTVPFDLKEAICTVMYAAPRIEIKELQEVRQQFLFKYGESLANDAMENRGNCVNPKIIHKLSVCAPENYLVFEYLGNIAKKYNVEWSQPYDNSTSSIFDNPVVVPSIHQPLTPLHNQPYAPQTYANAPPQERYIPQGGHSVIPGTGVSQFPSVPTSPSNFPSVPSNNNAPPPYSPSDNFGFPSVPSGGSGAPSFSSVPQSKSDFDFPSTPNHGGSGDSDFDDLTARFNRLKKK